MELKQRQDGLSVLLVDDDVEVRGLMVTCLKTLNIFSFIIEASDGQEAFQKYTQQNFDLVITDLTMPRVDGISFIQNVNRRVSREFNRELVPMIIVSGDLTSKEVLLAIKEGVKHTLVKPFSTDTLCDKVREVLGVE